MRRAGRGPTRVESFIRAGLATSRQRRANTPVPSEVADLLEAQRVAQTGSWTLELATGHSYRSPEYLRLFGIEPHQAGDTELILSRIDPRDRERVRAAIGRLVEHGEELAETYEVNLPDGTRRVIEARGRCEVERFTGRLRAVGTVQDVTEAQRLQRARLAAEERFRAVVDAAPDGLVIVDETGQISLVNNRAQEMFGYAAAELLGRPIEMLLPPEARERHRSHFHGFVDHPRARAMGEALELLARRRDGSTFPVEVSLSTVRADDGLLVASSIRDVTARREAQHEIARLAAIVESSHDAIVGKTLDGTITSWNPAAEALYGYSPEEAIGRSITMLLPDEERVQEMRSILGRVASGEVVDQLETRRRTKDGRILDVSLMVSPIRDSYGRVIGISTIGRDVTERRRARAALAAAEARFRAAFENAPIGVAIVGVRGPDRGRIVQANPALAAMIGRRPGELDGESIAALTHPDDIVRMDDALVQLDQDLTTQVEKRYVHSDGSVVWGLVTSTPIPSEDGEPEVLAVTQVLDITERKRFEDDLRFLADHDKLTGLFNRQRFETELQRVVDESRRYERRAALLILDLDGFKAVNDRFGHAAGDELVRRVSMAMRQHVRETDILARIGGDEFALILQDCTPGDAEMVASALRGAIRQRGVVTVGAQTAAITTSIGITTFDAGTGMTAAELVVEADIAMYDAKAAGKDRYALYDREVNRRAILSERHSWLERLRAALDEDAFVLHAQPIVGICEQDIPHYELLLRLPDENGELIQPSGFLYNAERLDLVGEIDRWVLRRAVRLLHEHSAAGDQIALSVNLSGRSMNDAQLPADLAAMLSAWPIPAGRLVIEVTETAAIVNIERACALAHELRALGCRFALDDFGSGFASFYYLKHLEFDYLKIDGEFIRQLATTETDQLVVRALVDIASGLNTATVAEYVGDQQTVEILRGLGIGYGQGNHLGRPRPLDEQLMRLPAATDR